MLDTAFKVATLASGIGTAAGVATIAAAGAARGTAASVATIAATTAPAAQITGYTQSLLGSGRAQLLLPPPAR